jgi:hypothetical protein
MEAETLKIARSAKDDSHRAILRAEEAHHKIDSYIKVNTVQHENMMRDVKKLEVAINATSEHTWAEISRINNRMMMTAGTGILILLSAIGAMAYMILDKVQ